MNKEEAAAYLGISVRTLQRHVQRGEIAVAYVRGRRGDEATFDEAELSRFKKTLDQPTYVTRATPSVTGGTGGAASSVQALARRDDGAAWIAEQFSMLLAQGAAMASHARPVVAVADKLTLSLVEAAQLAGLSRGHLREAIHTGKLKARIIGRGFKVKRADLEAYIKKL